MDQHEEQGAIYHERGAFSFLVHKPSEEGGKGDGGIGEKRGDKSAGVQGDMIFVHKEIGRVGLEGEHGRVKGDTERGDVNIGFIFCQGHQIGEMKLLFLIEQALLRDLPVQLQIKQHVRHEGKKACSHQSRAKPDCSGPAR